MNGVPMWRCDECERCMFNNGGKVCAVSDEAPSCGLACCDGSTLVNKKCTPATKVTLNGVPMERCDQCEKCIANNGGKAAALGSQSLTTMNMYPGPPFITLFMHYALSRTSLAVCGCFSVVAFVTMVLIQSRRRGSQSLVAPLLLAEEEEEEEETAVAAQK